MPSESESIVKSKLLALKNVKNQAALEEAVGFVKTFEFRSITRDHVLMNALRHLLAVAADPDRQSMVARSYETPFLNIDQEIKRATTGLENSLADCVAHDEILKKIRTRNNRLEKMIASFRNFEHRFLLSRTASHETSQKPELIKELETLTESISDKVAVIRDCLDELKSDDCSSGSTTMPLTDFCSIGNRIADNRRRSEDFLAELVTNDVDPSKMIGEQAAKNESFYSRKFVQDKITRTRTFIESFKAIEKIVILDRMIDGDKEKQVEVDCDEVSSSSRSLDKAAKLIESRRKVCAEVNALVDDLCESRNSERLKHSVESVRNQINETCTLSNRIRELLAESTAQISKNGFS